MSDGEASPETPRQREIRLLKLLSENGIIGFSYPQNTLADLLALKDLLLEQNIEGIPVPGPNGLPAGKPSDCHASPVLKVSQEVCPKEAEAEKVKFLPVLTAKVTVLGLRLRKI